LVIGERVKALREQKKMSQGDIQKRTGLLRCYLSRVENGHTVPSVDTLERLAHALGIPMYRFFTDDDHVEKPNIPREIIPNRAADSKQDRELRAFAKYFSRMEKKNRKLLIHVASKMANSAKQHRTERECGKLSSRTPARRATPGYGNSNTNENM
jgi:transcriptional regulator with XRE-family HTH domain